MNNGLNEVLSAAIQGIGHNVDVDVGRRHASLLRLAEAKRSEEMVPEPAISTGAETVRGPVVHRWNRSPAADLTAASKDNEDRTEYAEVADRTVAAFPPGLSLEQQAAPSHADAPPDQGPAGTFVAGSPGESAAVLDLHQKPPVATAPRPVAPNPAGDGNRIGPNGLHLAFSLCGFHSALMERLRQGETLTEREELLVTLARKDFARLRPFVTAMTLDRLNALVNAPELTREVAGTDAPGALEVFAVATLRSLGHRASQLLQEDGPDAALALFGEIKGEKDPLAIFQRVFTTALDLVEVFERIAPAKARLLARLAEALDSEVEKI
jgi:hypothetical protein